MIDKEKKIHVLLIEDDEEDYIITRDLLTDSPNNQFLLTWARNYEEGVEQIKKCVHDVYLIDYRLGKYDGIDLIKKAHGFACKAPLILLTGQQDREIDMQVMKMGVADYLVKNELQSSLLERSIRYAIERNHHNELERQKDEFISIASHELRTPITSMKAYAQLLMRQISASPKEINSEYVYKINSQIDKMVRLVEYLLDVSKIHDNKLNLNIEAININNLVKEAVEEVQHLYTKYTIVQEGSCANLVYADKDRIMQVIINLLTNAVKYSSDADKVIVSINEKDNNTVICVQDFGLGISKEDQKNLFDRFFRAKTVQEKKIAGIGLGLYISSEIIKLHGGKIWVESKVNEGSLFFSPYL